MYNGTLCCDSSIHAVVALYWAKAAFATEADPPQIRRAGVHASVIFVLV
jgi:hypothetical protein